MTDRVEVDSRDMHQLAQDLLASGGRAATAVGGIFYVAANKIKKGMQADARGHAYLPDLPNHVSYDKQGLFDYEIGFDKVGQGSLANIAAFGTSRTAPVMDHTAALRREEPHIVAQLLLAAEKSTLG